MTFQQLYLNAAKRIQKGESVYSCSAITACSNDDRVIEAKDLYARTMGTADRMLQPMDIWCGTCSYPFCDGEQSFRVLLLCMMAACVEDMLWKRR